MRIYREATPKLLNSLKAQPSEMHTPVRRTATWQAEGDRPAVQSQSLNVAHILRTQSVTVAVWQYLWHHRM